MTKEERLAQLLDDKQFVDESEHEAQLERLALAFDRLTESVNKLESILKESHDGQER